MSDDDDGQAEGDPPFGPAITDTRPEDQKYGDDIQPSTHNTFRHYHCNINGFSQQNDFVDAQNHARALQHLECNSASIVEHNCNMKLPEIRNNLYDILRRDDRRAATVFSHIESESHKFEGYQPGGTLLQVDSSMSSRIVYRHADEYARWSHVALSAKKGTRVHIISAYRVCQSTETNAGPNIAYMQQFRAMADDGIRKPKPRTQFFTDLDKTLTQVKANDKLIFRTMARIFMWYIQKRDVEGAESQDGWWKQPVQLCSVARQRRCFILE